MNRKVNTPCNFKCLFETEGLLKVAGSYSKSYLHCKCVDIWEIVKDRDVITKYLKFNVRKLFL